MCSSHGLATRNVFLFRANVTVGGRRGMCTEVMSTSTILKDSFFPSPLGTYRSIILVFLF